jgi:hypothetical protein
MHDCHSDREKGFILVAPNFTGPYLLSLFTCTLYPVVTVPRCLSIHMYLVPSGYRSTMSLSIHMYLVPSGYSSTSSLSIHMYLVLCSCRFVSSLSINGLKQFPFPSFALSVIQDPGFSWLLLAIAHSSQCPCIPVWDIPSLHPRLPFYLWCQSHVLASPSTFIAL